MFSATGRACDAQPKWARCYRLDPEQTIAFLNACYVIRFVGLESCLAVAVGSRPPRHGDNKWARAHQELLARIKRSQQQDGKAAAPTRFRTAVRQRRGHGRVRPAVSPSRAVSTAVGTAPLRIPAQAAAHSMPISPASRPPDRLRCRP